MKTHLLRLLIGTILGFGVGYLFYSSILCWGLDIFSWDSFQSSSYLISSLISMYVWYLVDPLKINNKN